jgi:pimeloyl-ACP methyl ester carboxylesterase
MTETSLRGEAAGVPYVALAPTPAVDGASAVVVWHMTDPPRSETAMAAALPLDGLPAWRIYLGLPMHGSRLPEGGLEELFGLGYEDAVLNLFEPITRQAVDEFPAALAELRRRLPIGDGPPALVGASAGALVALSALTDAKLPAGALALVSPATRLASVVAANERRFEVTYPWGAASRAAADRLDFVARADEIAERDVPVLLVVGALDDEVGFRGPAEELRVALAADSPELATLVEIPDMEHALAEEPGLDPAPQTAHAERVDAVVADWLRRCLERRS